MAAAVRITEQTRLILEALAKESGEPLPALVEKAVEAYRRQRLLEETNRGYGLLRSDPEAWQAELDERRTWEATLLDGLESDHFRSGPMKRIPVDENLRSCLGELATELGLEPVA